MASDPKVSYANARMKVLSSSDKGAPELFQVPNVTDFEDYKKDYVHYLINAARKDPPEGWKPTNENPKPYPSAARMYKEHTRVRDSWKETNEIIPRGVPLSTSLEIDQELSPSWSQPAKKDLFHASYRNYIIHTARFDPAYFNEKVEEFKTYAAKNRLNHLNASLYSFSIGYVQITKDQQKYLFECIADKKDCEMTLDNSHPERCCAPGLFTINNGCTSLSFNFGWFEYKKDDTQVVTDVRFLYSRLPREVIEFFESLPILFSDSADIKAEMMSYYLRRLFDVDINFKVLDIGSLAIATGCKTKDTTLFGLSVIVDGEPFPDGIQNMDNFWVRDSGKIPKEAESYLREKFMMLNKVFSTLFGLFLRQTFPDPDIVLSITEMSQLEFVYFFSEFIGQALIGSDNTKSIVNCATREDMIKTIADSGNKFVQPLCDLLADNPVAQEGGARYLHGNRFNFVSKQYDVIRRLDLHMFQCKVPNQDINIDQLTYRILYKRDVVFDNSGVPAKDVGLLPNPEFANTIYSLDLDNIVKLDRQFERDLVPALEEWARLNIPKIKMLLTELRGLSTDLLAKFWVPKVRIYESLRGIYYRMTGDYISVVELDRSIAVRVTNTRSHHENLESKKKYELDKAGKCFKSMAKREFKLQSMRVDFMNHKYQRGKDRVGIHQEVMGNIPGSNNRKNYFKRVKSTQRLNRRRDENSDSWVGRNESKRLKQADVLVNRSHNLSGSSSGSSAHHSKDLRHRLNYQRSKQ